LRVEKFFQQLSLRRRLGAKEVDPDAGVNEITCRASWHRGRLPR
jgi:hypothetical protein